MTDSTPFAYGALAVAAGAGTVALTRHAAKSEDEEHPLLDALGIAAGAAVTACSGVASFRTGRRMNKKRRSPQASARAKLPPQSGAEERTRMTRETADGLDQVTLPLQAAACDDYWAATAERAEAQTEHGDAAASLPYSHNIGTADALGPLGIQRNADEIAAHAGDDGAGISADW